MNQYHVVVVNETGQKFYYTVEARSDAEAGDKGIKMAADEQAGVTLRIYECREIV